MAGNKLTPKNWNDVQVAIATVSMVTTLACWNLFAGPDRVSALERSQEQATADPSAAAASPATPVGDGKVYFGGAEPKQVVVVIQQTLPTLALVVGAVVVEYQHQLNRLAMVVVAVVAEEQAVPNDPPLTLPCHGH